LNKLFKDKKIFAQEMKDLKNIFVLSKIVNNNILHKTFKIYLKKYKEQIKKFSIIDETKNQINDFYKEIKYATKKEEIDKEIWAILILCLIEINDNQKTKEILSIIESLKKK
jgi:hypothetical protein